jgi:hypothetical protein
MKNKQKNKRVHMVMPETIDDILQKIADERTISKAAVVRTLIKEEAKRMGVQ